MRHSILLKAKCEIIITTMPEQSKLGVLPDSDLGKMYLGKLHRGPWGERGYVLSKGNKFSEKVQVLLPTTSKHFKI